MAVNFSPIDIAKQHAARNGNNTGGHYFSLDDGETKYLRFLTAPYPTNIVSHSCGLSNIDILVSEFENASAAGQAVACPQCGQPLTNADVVMKRPDMVGVAIHRYVQTSDPSRKANFACLASMDNVAAGIVPITAEGQPLYQCPICSSPSNLNDNGKPKKPSYRLYGIAVEREIDQVIETVNGIPTPTIKGAKDVIVTEEDGTQHPSIVIVEMGWNNFWQHIITRFPEGQGSITYYDWRITRNGTSLNTTYAADPVNPDSPSAIDIAPYLDYMPDLTAMASKIGSPEHYTTNGWAVPGYVSQEQQTQAAPQAMPQAAPQQAMPQVQQAPQVQPVQTNQTAQVPPQQQPQGVNISWDVAQQQINNQ